MTPQHSLRLSYISTGIRQKMCEYTLKSNLNAAKIMTAVGTVLF
ncbi:hypothetical protein XBP1_2240012 [Xenorhabdus bovienii str. puntauvense]|uniref:Uncharacterized protein n=1 Tax=Xenorhabdus bovienii str. puntauvense TaxID=1398201 RepID=A0A077NES6_XENBV|nr:hypothetical protein XBP1_2240012 [Xenorhabdus bovienii str. puntauvense]